mgnify:CR=1 FL=1|jgi:hypothetical protein
MVIPPEPLQQRKSRSVLLFATMTVMVTGGEYGLVHPNSEAVYAANRLFFLLGVEADFKVLLDDLHEGVTPLLDECPRFLHPTSSLLDHAARFKQIEGWAASIDRQPRLLDQVHMIREASDGVGLRCDWGPYSLLYTLGVGHRGILRLQCQGTPPVREQPRWAGDDANAEVHPGFIDPNTGAYAGSLTCVSDGSSNLESAKARPRIPWGQ